MKSLMSSNLSTLAKGSFVILLTLSLLITGCSVEEESTQSITNNDLTGQVVDSKTRQSLENCIVNVGDKIDKTNEEGLFVIEDLPDGDYQVNIKKLNQEVVYEKYNEAITLNNNQDSKLEIDLKRNEQATTEGWFDIFPDPKPDDGKYKVESSKRTGPGNDFAVLYPSKLEEGPFPVVTWGNGTGATPIFYWCLLRNLASNGFIVVASRSTNTGSGDEMLKGVNWLLEENNKPDSKFHGAVDDDNIGATGHSQGGGGTINAGTDNRIKTTALIQPSPKRNIRKLNGPTFVITGGRDFIVSKSLVQRMVFQPSQVPTVFGNHKNSSHFTPVGDGRPFAEYIIAWFKAQLQNDQSAQDKFKSGQGIFTNNEWEVLAKKNEQLF